MQIACILDACTLINLIFIEDDDIVRILKRLDYYICDKVFKEVNERVYTKLDNLKKEGDYNLLEYKKKRDEIDDFLTHIRKRKIYKYEICSELGENVFNDVKRVTGYKKENGEFCSVVLCLFKSRITKVVEESNTTYELIPRKVYFYTDDVPAKEEFSSFFLCQQIGAIEDTADLLILLYRVEEKFTKKRLSDALSNLFSLYAREVATLIKKLREIEPNLKLKQRRDQTFMYNYRKMISKLETHDFDGIKDIRDYFSQKKKVNHLNDVINKYKLVFNLETKRNSNYLSKIKSYEKSINDIYLY